MANIELKIQHNDNIFSPPMKDEVVVEWERTGVAGKLTFTVIRVLGEEMSFVEGDRVFFWYDDKPIFIGYVFTKRRTKKHHIEVTCYDQLRYLKNCYTYVFENKTAKQIFESLCADFNLSIGELDETPYIIPSLIKDNTSAFDIILEALEETLTATGSMYIIYDDFGKLCLKDCANMKTDVLISQNTAQDFDYTSSIDEESYNEIVLYYKDENGTYIPYYASSQHNIEHWGTLRYYEEIKIPAIAQNKADVLLDLYNRKTRSLTVKNAFGDTSIRGGTIIPVILDLGDLIANNYMLVKRVTHTFKGASHFMELELEGAWDNT